MPKRRSGSPSPMRGDQPASRALRPSDHPEQAADCANCASRMHRRGSREPKPSWMLFAAPTILAEPEDQLSSELVQRATLQAQLQAKQVELQTMSQFRGPESPELAAIAERHGRAARADCPYRHARDRRCRPQCRRPHGLATAISRAVPQSALPAGASTTSIRSRRSRSKSRSWLRKAHHTFRSSTRRTSIRSGSIIFGPLRCWRA